MFIMFWKGWGILVPAVAAIMSILSLAVGDALLSDAAFERHSVGVAAVGLAGAAAIVWRLGRRLNGVEARVLLDQATGQTVTLRSRHTFYFLRMEHWGILLGIAAAALIALSLVAGDVAKAEEIAVGGVYSVEDGTDYGVVKVLAVEGEAVHVRLYAETFAERPTSGDTVTLTLGDQDSFDYTDVGVPYVAVERAYLTTTDPELLRTEPITQEELDGRSEWEEIFGGYVLSESDF